MTRERRKEAVDKFLKAIEALEKHGKPEEVDKLLYTCDGILLAMQAVEA